MADMKVSLTGNELAELRNLLAYQAGNMERIKLSKAEALQYLTMQRDHFEMASTPETKLALEILKATGETIGYTPAFRCLVKGMEPEQSIKWKE